MVYDSVRKEQPNISLGTVYRNLSFLVDSGKVRKIFTGMGPDRFDGHINRHFHFICRCCGNVGDLDVTPEDELLEKASLRCNGILDSYELQFFGKCGSCLSKNE